MRVVSEELFGPVTPITRFASEEEALRLANATPAGLAAFFYSRDLGRAFRFAERLECGMVGVNETGITADVAPFGGVKESGLGREQSRHGIGEYLEMKTVALGVGAGW
jgi:succinate-semialdehyde dehydrogenase/glutarate-semialdehyde dehydrogenase